MLNITKKLEPGKNLADFISLPDLSKTINKAIDPQATKFTSFSDEISLGGPEPQTLMANVSVVRDENAETLGVVCILRDITQLKEIDRVKSQFVSMVAHELRAPLSAISNYLATYLSGSAGDNPEFNRQMLQRSRERANSLLHLVEDLLQISRMEAQKVSQKKELLHLSKIIKNTVELLTSQANERHIKIEMKMPSSCPTIEADHGEMEQLFTNLISNAIKYNREHGKIEIICQPNDNFFNIKIKDTGIGIAKEHLPHIFDDFFRISREETRYITGTGLGLSIVKRIVDSNLGRINAESELNKGTTFTVRFPIKQN
jgi:signal transduction histidine kinase